MPLTIDKVKEEGRKVIVTTVFFAIGFCIIVVHNRLLTEGTGFQTVSFARALVGGLIVAKVLLSVDMLPFFDAFPHKPIVYNIGWKTSLYAAGAMFFLYMEPFLKHLVKGTGLHASHSEAWRELMMSRTWAIMIWLVVLLLVFVTMKEISQVIGKDQFKYMFLGRRGKPTTVVRHRDAA
jgi:hypothetical protein